MIRPLVLTAGSRGDIEPFLALFTVLSSSPNVDQTTLCIPSDYTHLAPDTTKNSKVVPINFTLDRAREYLPAFRTDVAKNETSNRKPEEESIMLGLITRDLLLPETKRIFSTAKACEASVILTSVITHSIAQIISEKLNIPLIMIHLQPIIPSRFYPHVMYEGETAAAAMYALNQGDTTTYESDRNLEGYHKFARSIYDNSIEAINKERSDFNLKPMTVDQMLACRSNPDMHELVAVQSQLIPRPPDFPENAHIVGSLATAYIPATWDPESSQAELISFLQSGPPPVAVSYGSMESQGAATEVMRSLLTGMERAGVQRIVILPGKADLGLHHLDEEKDKNLLSWAKGRVFETSGNIQYSWLLPQCEMFFSHCGAGSVSAALRAGVPVLGTPILADQIFFAELVKRRQLGERVGTIGLPSVTAESVFNGIMQVRSDAVRAAVKAFAEEEQRLDESIEKVGKLIEQISSGTFRKK